MPDKRFQYKHRRSTRRNIIKKMKQSTRGGTRVRLTKQKRKNYSKLTTKQIKSSFFSKRAKTFETAVFRFE